ncbi:MAG: hypothetical protein PHD76_03245 [Methylacidiphilales bacterium]|nr:hypothetical protein [Candidatus Methylacidiphilales bacterium]
MSHYLVMTVIGPDRPGLVDSLASIILKQEGNWLESRMCHLGGQFAGILRIQVAPEHEQALIEQLQSLSAQGLAVVAYPENNNPPAPDDQLVTIELVGQDRPGIVSQISAILAQYSVNVEDLKTECSSAPMSGETLFQATAILRLPRGCDLKALRSDLEKITSNLMVDMIFGKPLP